MKKLSIYIIIPIIAILLASLWSFVFTGLDIVILTIELALLVALALVTIINCIPKPIKIILLTTIITVLGWFVLFGAYYLRLSTIITLVISVTINTIISKNLSKIVKVAIPTVAILFLIWMSMIIIDSERYKIQQGA